YASIAAQARDRGGGDGVHGAPDVVELCAPAGVGIGNRALRHDVRDPGPAGQQVDAGGGRFRRAGADVAQVLQVGAQQPVEAAVVVVMELAGAQAGDVDAVAGGGGDGAFVRRVADVPVAGAGRIEAHVAQAGLVEAGAQRALGHGRAADVADRKSVV